ncbi:MAG: hypothetical protein ACM3H8_05110 [Sphingobacteriales bacterium]
METRIILATLCFTLSFLSLIRGLHLIKADQQQSHSGTLISASDAIETLKLFFFNGIKSRNGIVLMWKAGPQVLKYGFEIERKDAAGNYTTLLRIEKPDADKPHKFIDCNYSTEHTEYRLKQTDAFGVTRISKPVLINNC